MSKLAWMALSAFLCACGSDAVSDVPDEGSGGATTAGAGGSGGATTSFGLDVAWEDCPLRTGGGGPLKSAQCATIEVPLHWDEPAGRKIELFLKRYGATPEASTRQLWLLAGGPGQPGVGFEGLAEQVASAAPTMSFYMLDHRGVGRSTRLGCPAEEAIDSDGSIQITVDEMPACLAHVRGTFDDAALTGFSTTEAAHDVGELIAHLRRADETSMVWGGSYGTHWANRYAQLYPSQSEAIVLGALAINNELARIDGRFGALALAYLERCQIGPCGDAFAAAFGGQTAPDVAIDLLRGSGKTLCPELEAEGWEVRSLKVFFGSVLYDWNARKLIPPLVYRAARCSPDDVAVFAHLAGVLTAPVATIPPAQRLWGMFITHHVIKSELWTDPPLTATELQSIEEEALAINGTSALLLPSYEQWPRYPRPDIAYGSPSGRVLMVHGELDFTPSALYQPAVDHYLGLRDDNRFFLLPRAPHGLAGPTTTGVNCGPWLEWHFAKDPTAEPTDCGPDILPLDFVPDANLSMGYLGTADPWDGAVVDTLAPAPPPSLVEVRARFLRRR